MSRPGIDRVFERRLSSPRQQRRSRRYCRAAARAWRRSRCASCPTAAWRVLPHPRLLGSALTNEHITTDYSEALIELVTPAFAHSWELLQYLLDLHQFVYRHLGEELLWATSMPCAIERDEDIPLAQLRQLARRAHEDHLPQRSRTALRAHDAGDLRRALQLLLPAAVLGGLRGGCAARAAHDAGVRLRPVTSTCCATTAASAGSCCTCSASRRSCAVLPAGRDSTCRTHAGTLSSRTPPACA